jgi:hypothetical protein
MFVCIRVNTEEEIVFLSPIDAHEMKKPQFRSWMKYLVLGSFFLTACVSENVASDIVPKPSKDSVYFPVLSKYTKSDSVYASLQKVIDISVVKFTEEMKNSYLNRLARIRQSNPLQPQAEIVGTNVNSFLTLDFASSGPKIGFLVSVYTPDSSFQELENKNLWNIRYGNLPVSKIQKLTDKDVLDAFFPFVNKWSTEYLVIFEQGAAENPQPKPLRDQLIFSSSLVSLSFQW